MKKKEHIWMGFDLGGTKMLALLFNAKFGILAEKRRKTKAMEGAAIGIARIVETMEQILADAGTDKNSLAGIGIAVPGPLDLDRGILLESPNMSWGRLPLKSALVRHFHCPVTVLNDVDAGVYGEYRFGAARGSRCTIGVFPGTGIGGGCVYEGRVLRGKTGSCFEIGHCQVLPDGPLCGCGQKGCLETVASRLVISAAALAAVCRGEAPNLLKESGTDITNIRSSALARSIAAGDQSIERIVKDAARWIGIGVANAIQLLAPDIVVLGGGLVEAMPALFLQEVDRVARNRVMPAYRQGFKTVTARLGDHATAIGAAAWAEENAATAAMPRGK